MNKKYLFANLLIIFIFCFAFVGRATAALGTSTQEDLQDIQEALSQEVEKGLEGVKEYTEERAESMKQGISNKISQSFQKTIRELPGKVLEGVKRAVAETMNLVRGKMNVNIKQWFSRRKEAVKQGIEEEKQELGEDLREVFSMVWQKIKDLMKKEKEDSK